MICAFEKISPYFSDYTLHIYGDGELREELSKLAEMKGLKNKVVFHGLVKDVLKFVNKASLFVSSSDYEGISNAMLEALALGIPTICTDCPIGGARKTINDGVNGLLVPVGDVDALADAMTYLLSNPQYATKLGIEGRRIVEQLSDDKVADLWMDFINRIVKNETCN